MPLYDANTPKKQNTRRDTVYGYFHHFTLLLFKYNGKNISITIRSPLPPPKMFYTVQGCPTVSRVPSRLQLLKLQFCCVSSLAMHRARLDMQVQQRETDRQKVSDRKGLQERRKVLLCAPPTSLPSFARPITTSFSTSSPSSSRSASRIRSSNSG